MPSLLPHGIQMKTSLRMHLASNDGCGCCLVTKSCPTLCDPMDYSPPGSSVCGISQARILEWVAISFSRGSSQPRDWTHVSCTGRQILYCWVTREALLTLLGYSLASTCMLSRFSHVQLFATPWTIAHQAPLSMGFSRQGHWSGLPCPSLIVWPVGGSKGFC